jgi:IS30 family transposase
MAYHHLNIQERDIIATQRNKGMSYRAIANMLNRSHTTIAREIRRLRKLYTSEYCPKTAQNLADYWRLTPRHAKCRHHTELYQHVIKRLEQGDSPDVISGRLKRTHANNPHMQISHETIYRWVYDDRFDGGTLYKNLLRKRAFRKRRGRFEPKGGTLKDRVSIHDRPEAIELRNEFNHWEGDLVVGKGATGYLVTLTERKSRRTLATKIKTKHANTVSNAIIKLLKPLKEKVESITFDNGREFYGFKKVAKAIKADIYFADPYSSWQRGCNENANGMIRRYFPKGSDFEKITCRQLQKVMDKINNRPRKILDYQTANEVFLAG